MMDTMGKPLSPLLSVFSYLNTSRPASPPLPISASPALPLSPSPSLPLRV
jgi:hypothetical protein